MKGEALKDSRDDITLLVFTWEFDITLLVFTWEFNQRLTDGFYLLKRLRTIW